MHLTIDIPEDRAVRFQQQAQARGMTIDRWLLGTWGAECARGAEGIVAETNLSRSVWEGAGNGGGSGL